MTVFNPLPLKRFDLVHGFNCIPMIGKMSYILGFESHWLAVRIIWCYRHLVILLGLAF